MTTYRFITKQKYLHFRYAWAQASQSKMSLTGAHHILYNILRNKPIDHGFTPITNTNKLANGQHPHLGLYSSVYELNRMINLANNPKSYSHQTAQEFVAVFGDTFTIEDLQNIPKPNLKGKI